MSTQVSTPVMDTKLEKPQLVWPLKSDVHFSFQMSTRCPIGHESENFVAR